MADTEGLVREVHKVSYGRYRVSCAAGTQGILVAGKEGGVLQVHKVF